MTQKKLFPGENQGQAITVQEDPAQVDFQSIFSGSPMSPEVLNEKKEFFKEQISIGIDSNPSIAKIKIESDATIKEIINTNIDTIEKVKKIEDKIKECRDLKDRIDSQAGPGKKFLAGLKNHVQDIENGFKKPLEEAITLANGKLNAWQEKERIRIQRENAAKLAEAEAEAEKKKKVLATKLAEAIEADDQKKAEKISKRIDGIESKPVLLEKELPTIKVLEILDDYKFLALLVIKHCFQITPEEKAFLLNQEIGPGIYFTSEDIERLEFMIGFLQNFRIPGNFPNLSTACIKIDTDTLMKSLEKLPIGYYAWGNQVDEKDEKKLLNETWGQIFEKTKKTIVRR